MRIIERACAEKGIAVTESEVDTALDKDLKMLKTTREDFVTKTLKQYNKSLVEWREDVLRPRLLLQKLVGPRVKVDEADMRRAFENQYGPKVSCRMILWPGSNEKAARKLCDECRTDEAAFDRAAKSQGNAALAATGGQVDPFSRYGYETANYDTASQRLADAAFQLKLGEVSAPIRSGDQIIVLQCVKQIPAAAANFDSVKPELFRILVEKKIETEIPKLFQALKDDAKPKLLLK